MERLISYAYINMPWKLMSVEPSSRAGKKLQANFFDNATDKRKTVHFGAKGYRDFTTIKDKDEALEARRLYWTRHRKDLESGDPLSPGYLSLYILWGNNQSISQNVSEYRKRFKL
jgi:hypothetical protein